MAKSKYNAIRTNGYDSKKEAKRAQTLELMQMSGQISELKMQVEFELIPAQYEVIIETTKKGIKKLKQVCIERKCSYYADFTYLQNDEYIVEDCKSNKRLLTKDYLIKRKLMLYLHHIKIKEYY